MTHKISLSDIEILRLLLQLLTEYDYPSPDMRWQLIEVWAKDLIRKEASHG